MFRLWTCYDPRRPILVSGMVQALRCWVVSPWQVTLSDIKGGYHHQWIKHSCPPTTVVGILFWWSKDLSVQQLLVSNWPLMVGIHWLNSPWVKPTGAKQIPTAFALLISCVPHEGSWLDLADTLFTWALPMTSPTCAWTWMSIFVAIHI